MKNNGKQLEKVIRLIQEAFKDSENTQILSNHKLLNSSGNNREIDILIVTKINDFDIQIAIECKDFNKKIPVEKIEAFESKCQRINNINKKIFVSKKGFQSDAIEAANDFDIELYTADELTVENLSKMLTIKQIVPTILPIAINSVLSFNADKDILLEIQKTFVGDLFRLSTDEPIKIQEVLYEAINENKKQIFGLALLEWMKIDSRIHTELTIPVSFGLKFYDFYIKNDSNKIELLNGNFTVPVKFDFISPQKISGRSLKDSQGKLKANSINVQIKNDLESHMIIKDDNEYDIFLTDNNKTRKLKTLFTYNPVTDELKRTT